MKNKFNLFINSKSFTTIIVLVVALIFFLTRLALGWTNPSANPPSGNGALYYSGGNVGIGISPSYKFDVSGTFHAAGASTLSSSLYVAGASTLDSSLTFTQGASTRNVGIVGTYSPTSLQAIWAMGSSYQLAADGTAGTLYGLSYSYEPNYGGAGNNPGAISGLGHQMQWRANGATQTAIGTGIYTTGGLYLSGNTGSYLYNDGTYIKSTGYLRAVSGIYSDGWVQSAGLTYSGGNFVQGLGSVIYPGSISGLTTWQTSYYLASHAQWGIYTNTSFNAAGGVYSAGSAVATVGSAVYSCPTIQYDSGCSGWQNQCIGQLSLSSSCQVCSGGVWVQTGCTAVGHIAN